jgi:hypothetical protein
MSNDLIFYLKNQNDNIYSLNVGEASSHMLAMHKFIEVYMKNYRESLDNEEDQKSCTYEAKKILDFLSVMTNILASSNLDNYFHNTVLISKSKLEDFGNELCDAEKNIKEELYHAIRKTSNINRKLLMKLNEL